MAVSGHGGLWPWRSLATAVSGHGGLWPRRSLATAVSGHGGLWPWRSLATAVSGHGGLWPRRSLATAVSGHGGLWPWRSLATAVSGHGGLWPRRSLATAVSGHGGLWPWRSLAMAVSGHGGLWPRRSLAMAVSGCPFVCISVLYSNCRVIWMNRHTSHVSSAEKMALSIFIYRRSHVRIVQKERTNEMFWIYKTFRPQLIYSSTYLEFLEKATSFLVVLQGIVATHHYTSSYANASALSMVSGPRGSLFLAVSDVCEIEPGSQAERLTNLTSSVVGLKRSFACPMSIVNNYCLLLKGEWLWYLPGEEHQNLSLKAYLYSDKRIWQCVHVGVTVCVCVISLIRMQVFTRTWHREDQASNLEVNVKHFLWDV